MANGIHSSISQVRLSAIGQLRTGNFPAALTGLAIVIFFSSLVLLYFFRNSSADSMVVQCDKSAVIAANLANENTSRGKDWRLERQQAFQRCMDESFQTMQKLRP
jgi:hypothetical protein